MSTIRPTCAMTQTDTMTVSMPRWRTPTRLPWWDPMIGPKAACLVAMIRSLTRARLLKGQPYQPLQAGHLTKEPTRLTRITGLCLLSLEWAVDRHLEAHPA